jgi:hypothetical protein
VGKHTIWAAFAIATILFYFVPLFDAQTSIQGDAVNSSYSAQKYFADSVREGHLPQWTPFLFSGFPFLADPQTGAWYPLHWPFFLVGITPRAIEWELALHVFLALAGTYLFAQKLIGNSMAAVIAAVFYAGGGFFAANSVHVGIFETAALLPWLLWSGLRAFEGASMFVPGAIGGLILLLGQFQMAVYCFFALLFLAAARRVPWKRAASVLTVAAGIAFLLGAIQMLPALELLRQADRAAASGGLKLAALATLAIPDFYGAVSGNYSGPPDVTQFYFYAGILLVPLAIGGIVKKRSIVALALIVPALLYAFVAVNIWFVAALGLALAAASGAAWLAERFQKSWLLAAVLMFSAADMWFWNMADNQLAYAGMSYADKFGDAFTAFQKNIGPVKQTRFARIWSAFDTNAFGPLNSSLEGRTEVTYGYNPLELSRYREYLQAMEQNQKLMNGLAVTNAVDTGRGAMFQNPAALPRIYAPPQVRFVSNHTAARTLLASLDPAKGAIVETTLRPIAPGNTAVEIVGYRGDYYRAKYSAPFDCLLRIAVPYFPGWSAAIDGNPTPVFAVDGALSGVLAPAGNHELTFHYHSNWFLLGASLSALALIGIILSSIFIRA